MDKLLTQLMEHGGEHAFLVVGQVPLGLLLEHIEQVNVKLGGRRVRRERLAAGALGTAPGADEPPTG